MKPRFLAFLNRYFHVEVLTAVFAALMIAVANFSGWGLFNRAADAPNVDARVAGLSYSPFQRADDPVAGRFPKASSIDSDLAFMATLTGSIRSYSSHQFPDLPRLAQKHGLKLTAGIWLTGAVLQDDAEINAALHNVAAYSNVQRLIVGNETVLKKVLTVEQLMVRIDEVRAKSSVPVSTAEPWHVWLNHPELASHVDFITIHLLPYWEGIDSRGALAHALFQLNTIQKRFPSRSVVIGEVGWPSEGARFGGARASPDRQAIFLRQFLAAAAPLKLDYFLMEAMDQPWKVKEEGHAGGYWGIADASRRLKFEFHGPVERDPYWRVKAGISSGLGFALLLLTLPRLSRMRPIARLCFALLAQLTLTGSVILVTHPMTAYFQTTDWWAMAIFIPTLFIMIAILLAHAFEFSELFWEGSLRRQFAPKKGDTVAHFVEDKTSVRPKVSIHVPCCNEPPDQVIATLKSLSNLNYSRFEVIVVVNNTVDEALWAPIEQYVKSLPAHFRFYCLPTWPGYKAGALNFALTKTSADTEIVGVIDADYVVMPDWLATLTGYFRDLKVGIVQLPQAHRDWGGQSFRAMMNWEYEGFFRIGMHHRNERNAIIQHGTMTLIQLRALKRHGGWSEWCVSEDAELGLRLMQQGYTTVYVDQIWGRGLTPDGFDAFKAQRMRWAQGGMQILKSQWRDLLGVSASTQPRISRGQRYHFLAGWLPWLGDALHLAFAIAAMLWTLGLVLFPRFITLPTALFMLPLATFVLAKLVVGPLLYRRRVQCSSIDIIGASVAGMAVSHGIARGVIAGLFKPHAKFEVTRKARLKGALGASAPINRPPVSGVWRAVREEALMLLGLIGSMCLMLYLMLVVNSFRPEYILWIGMLVVQALPYAAALLCAALSLRPDVKGRIAVALSSKR
jgi:exo-beta-1,3-glucanase (GH17 family)/cellulose synthase/poly-beta-1,6-N-acetylglucosamine synthase-like glycosyltransferase